MTTATGLVTALVEYLTSSLPTPRRCYHPSSLWRVLLVWLALDPQQWWPYHAVGGCGAEVAVAANGWSVVHARGRFKRMLLQPAATWWYLDPSTKGRGSWGGVRQRCGSNIITQLRLGARPTTKKGGMWALQIGKNRTPMCQHHVATSSTRDYGHHRWGSNASQPSSMCHNDDAAAAAGVGKEDMRYSTNTATSSVAAAACSNRTAPWLCPDDNDDDGGEGL
ncbi:hypothetical protein EDB83DRAFT_2310343 [Lactarius deliciosus]|nr:hypothetical protein EDB83DRAFT_2310343 [Lactarius deliciosus]